MADPSSTFDRLQQARAAAIAAPDSDEAAARVLLAEAADTKQQGGGRAHKYDASVLSGAWMKDSEGCPGCCPQQVNIMAMGQDAFQLKPGNMMFTRDGGTDNFRFGGCPGREPCMALVLSENDIKLAGTNNFNMTKINRTNLVDRAQPQPPMPQVMQHY